MTTHFRSGPAFGLSAEVKSKVPHSISCCKEDCQVLTVNANLSRLFKINLNHIIFSYIGFFAILLGRRNYPDIKNLTFKNPTLCGCQTHQLSFEFYSNQDYCLFIDSGKNV